MRLHLSTSPSPTSTTEALHVYNALDCCITLEVLEAILPQLDEVTDRTYNFALELQAPILEMECRGVRIDRERISVVRDKLDKDLAYIQEGLDQLCIEGLGIPAINANSPKQVYDLMYSVLALPPVKRMGKITCDRKALEKLRSYFYAEPLISHILAIRDIRKKLGVLKTSIDPDGRIRTSYNIAGTDTGRLNSHESAFGSGTNLQNITEELREIFVADPGKKLAYIDLQQVQSRNVGAICWNLFQVGTYLDFCESGDLHTGVCMMTWPDKPWHDKRPTLQQLTDPVAYSHNRAIADESFYRVDSFRQGSKKLGHATNFLGKPPQISQQTRIPVELISDFQPKYFRAFPEIAEWHKWLRMKLIRDGWITTITGRKRWFHGRRYDDETVRAAAAFEPQDMEGYINNRGMYQLWRSDLPVELLMSVHDAILVQYDEAREDELIPKILEAMQVPIPLMHGRTFLVPHEAQVGWNWGHVSERNPDGLIKFKGTDPRKRSEKVSFLARQFHRAN